MKLSILIPCYNFSEYLEECIKSVLNQIMDFEYEILIGDDCSTDNSLEIINTFKSDKIKVFKNDNNLGFYKNIRNLFESSKGEYISYLDGDDYFIDPYKIQKQVDFLDSNKEYSLHCTGCYVKHNNPSDDYYSTPLKDDISAGDILDINYISFGRTFRNIPNLIKDWMDNITYLDWVINYELLKYGKAKCESWVSGCYRVTGKGAITSHPYDEILANVIKIRDILKNDYKSFTKNKSISEDLLVHININDYNNITYQNILNIKNIGFNILITSKNALPNVLYDYIDHFYYEKDINSNLEDEPFKISHWVNTNEFRMNFLFKEIKNNKISDLKNVCKIASSKYKYILSLDINDSILELPINELNDLISKDTDLHFLQNDLNKIFYNSNYFLENSELKSNSSNPVVEGTLTDLMHIYIDDVIDNDRICLGSIGIENSSEVYVIFDVEYYDRKETYNLCVNNSWSYLIIDKGNIKRIKIRHNSYDPHLIYDFSNDKIKNNFYSRIDFIK